MLKSRIALLSAVCVLGMTGYASASLIAFDSFEDGALSDATPNPGNGTGWLANTWAVTGGTGGVSVGSGTPTPITNGGTYFVNMNSSRAISRTLNLSQVSNAKLTLAWKTRFWDNEGESITVEFHDGANWNVLATLTTTSTGSGGSPWTITPEYNLSAYAFTGTTQTIKITANQGGPSGTSDNSYFDLITVTGTIPEPASLALLGLGALLMLPRRRAARLA